MKLIKFIIAFGIMGCLLLTSCAGLVEEDNLDRDLYGTRSTSGFWTTETGPLYGRENPAVGVVNGKIYLMGGFGGDNNTEMYNPSSDSWTILAPKPSETWGFGVGVIGGKIYAIGRDGSNEVYNPSNNQWTQLSNFIDSGWVKVGVVNGLLYAFTEENTGAYYPGNDTWISKTPMLTPRSMFEATVLDGKIYVVGGSDGDMSGIVEVYDPSTDTWSQKSSMRISRGRFAIATVNEKIYAMDGYRGGSIANCEVYDPVSDSWQDIPSSPTPRRGVAAGVVDGVIYVLGGLGGEGFITEAYHIEAEVEHTGFWATKAPMPTERHYLSAVTLNGKIYAIGGDGLNQIEEYDPEANAWSIKTPSTYTHTYPGVAVIDNKIYVIGGRYEEGYGTPVELYDPLTDTWTIKQPFPCARERFGMAVVNEKIYIIGGDPKVNSDAGANSNVPYCYNPKLVVEYDPGNEIWTQKASMPDAKDRPGVAVYNDEIFVFGGSGMDDDETQVYDPVSNNWTIKSPMPRVNGQFGIGVLNNQIHVLGGVAGTGKTHDVYDPTTDVWTESEPLPTGRYGLAVAVIDQKLYAIGGAIGIGGETFDVNEVFIMSSTSSDFDSDGLTNQQELDEGTDPNDGDTDDDSLGDGFEVIFSKTDPNNWDTNGNGVGDGLEFISDKGYVGSFSTLNDNRHGLLLTFDNYDLEVRTDSTIIEGDFNKETKQLTITVSNLGQSTGKTEIFIPKELANADKIQISIDGSQVTHTVTSQGDFYVASVEYGVGVHELSASFEPGQQASPDTIFLILLVVITIIAVVGIIVVRNGRLVVSESDPVPSTEELSKKLEEKYAQGAISEDAYNDMRAVLDKNKS